MENTGRQSGFTMVLSVVLAVVLWMFVHTTLNLDDSRTLRNLPVVITGLDILESRGLMLTSGMDQTATIHLAGKQAALAALAADTDAYVTITVDMTSVDGPGEYARDVQVAFHHLSGIPASSSVVLTDRYPSTLTYTVAREAKRSVPVRGILTGSVAEGYQAGKFSFSPEQIEIRGEESAVNQIDYVLVTLNEENMTAPYHGELPYAFVTFTGGEADTDKIVSEPALVRTTLPVFQWKEVPLTVNLQSGGGAASENVKATIRPATIIVSGSAADLEPLKEISLGRIDLAKVLGNDTLVFPIHLSSELTNVSGETEASVELEIIGLTTLSLETDNIEMLHIPDGYNVETVTKTRQVQIRGNAESVETVDPSQLRIVADLEGLITATGSQTVPVKVYLDGRSDIGVVGDYSIVVSVTKA